LQEYAVLSQGTRLIVKIFIPDADPEVKQIRSAINECGSATLSIQYIQSTKE
jgi:hypothetical protein